MGGQTIFRELEMKEYEKGAPSRAPFSYIAEADYPLEVSGWTRRLRYSAYFAFKRLIRSSKSGCVENSEDLLLLLIFKVEIAVCSSPLMRLE